MYTLYKFHFLNGVSEINQLFDDILIIWPAPVCIYIHIYTYACVYINNINTIEIITYTTIHIIVNICFLPHFSRSIHHILSPSLLRYMQSCEISHFMQQHNVGQPSRQQMKSKRCHVWVQERSCSSRQELLNMASFFNQLRASKPLIVHLSLAW